MTITFEQYKNGAKLNEMFETKPCTRCGGCGRYSWCQMYGDTCFKCNGRGWYYSRRGEAQLNAYIAMLSIPFCEVKIGQVVQSPRSKKWFTVTASHPSDSILIVDGIRLPEWELEWGNSTTVEPETTLIRIAHSNEECYAAYLKALETKPTQNRRTAR
jgi:hypothetical protein